MFHNNKIVVVMPAYNAARTIERTYREIPLDLVDEVVVTDDASGDETVRVARELGLHTVVHEENRGLRDLNGREIALMAPLVVLVVWIGVQPNAFLGKTAGSLERLSARIEAVRAGQELVRLQEEIDQAPEVAQQR